MLRVLMTFVAAWTIPGIVFSQLADPPVSKEERTRLAQKLDAEIEKLDAKIRKVENDPSLPAGLERRRLIALYSTRGSANFHRGRFQDSVDDFDKMIERDPKLKPSHWRRGLSLYYTGDFEESAHQFELCHTLDDVDRENGLWRFLAQSKIDGLEKARGALLEYEKDDRAPFPDLYEMIAGNLSGKEVLARIRQRRIDATAREKQLFSAHLYIGLFAETQKDRKIALAHLRKAIANRWAHRADGSGYMWHVARIHYELLSKESKKSRQ